MDRGGKIYEMMFGMLTTCVRFAINKFTLNELLKNLLKAMYGKNSDSLKWVVAY